jgi:tyrosyl-tRNA synthetase
LLTTTFQHTTILPLKQQNAAAPASTTTAATAPPPSANVVEILRSRGLVQEVTSDELERAAAATRLSVYCGFDPTADSLHLGNLLGIVVLAWFQRCGHEAVALVGGATGRVGDPSGRSSERPVLSEEAIERNVAGIRRLLTSILERSTAAAASAAAASGDGSSSAGGVRVLNNLDWFGPMSFLGFLRDVGKYARVGAMLAKDSVRSRMESESGISFTEFAYQLLQGYDFVHLCREHGVRVQIGGSDQWGNITAGTDLIRRLLGGGGNEGSLASAGGSDAGGGVASSSSSSSSSSDNGSNSSNGSSQDGGASAAPACYGLTFPLLVDSEGRKFGKSTGGAVWLSADRLSPYKFYQHLFAVADADVIKLLRMLTFLPLDEIAAIEASMQSPGYAPNTAQRRLAEAVTEFVHGPEGLATALRATEALRPGGDTQLDAAALEAIAGDAPTCALPRESVEGRLLTDVIVAAKLLPSKGEARRMAKNGGLYLNNTKVADDARVVAADDLIDGRLALLAAGKKNKLLLRIEG